MSIAIAKQLLEKNILTHPGYNWKELFEIRDACLSLAKYGLEDKELLKAVLQYLGEKIGE